MRPSAILARKKANDSRAILAKPFPPLTNWQPDRGSGVGREFREFKFVIYFK